MPKMKTHKGLKKRIRVSKGGKGKKVKRQRGGHAHLMSGKGRRLVRRQRRREVVEGAYAKKLIRALEGK